MKINFKQMKSAFLVRFNVYKGNLIETQGLILKRDLCCLRHFTCWQLLILKITGDTHHRSDICVTSGDTLDHPLYSTVKQLSKSWTHLVLSVFILHFVKFSKIVKQMSHFWNICWTEYPSEAHQHFLVSEILEQHHIFVALRRRTLCAADKTESCRAFHSLNVPSETYWRRRRVPDEERGICCP